LNYWKIEKLISLTNQIQIFFNQCHNPRRSSEAILRAIIYDIFFGLIDLSLFYRTGRTSHIVSKVVLEALRNVISTYLMPMSQDLEILSPFLKPGISSDELGRPFERLLLSVLLLKGSITVKTTNLDNKDPYFIDLTFSKAVSVSKSLPDEKVVDPVIFIQENKDFPISDFILIKEDRVIILQLTVGSVSNKIPNKRNSYTAIYNPAKLQNLINSQKLSIPRQNEAIAGQINFADSLLSLTCQQSGPVIVDPKTKLLIDQNSRLPVNFHYIIITTESWSKKPNNAMVNKAKEFPWIRVIYRENLGEIFSSDVIDLLPKHYE